MRSIQRTTRREFLGRTAAGLAATVAGTWPRLTPAADDKNKKPFKVAALITTFFPMSHAHVILENFLVPYLFNGQVTRSDMQVASFFVDQIHTSDMSRDVAKEFDVPIFPTITD